jgi:hypothetical protein
MGGFVGGFVGSPGVPVEDDPEPPQASTNAMLVAKGSRSRMGPSSALCGDLDGALHHSSHSHHEAANRSVGPTRHPACHPQAPLDLTSKF